MSFVLLHTDNVTKSFAASTSLVLSTFASYLLFEYNIGMFSSKSVLREYDYYSVSKTCPVSNHEVTVAVMRPPAL